MEFIDSIHFKHTNIHSKIIQDYLNGVSDLKAFYSLYPNIASFQKQIEHKQETYQFREEIYSIFNQQYQNLHPSLLQKKNITALKDKNTFVITTAHQLNLFTGPLYYIYKICSTIKTCQILQNHYPAYHFVPLFWLGSEDHDFEEIQSTHLFNQTLTWQTGQQGAVGRMQIDSHYISQISALKNILGDKLPYTSKIINPLLESTHYNEYAQAVQYFISTLFASYGLIVLNQDDPALKLLFTKELKAELLESFIYKNTRSTIDALSIKYKIQAQPREINLFYLKDHIRQRIQLNPSTKQYHIVNSAISFSKKELLDELHNHPERFSPNVLMRPVFQESVLPNIAYVGGGGELAYWLELKSSFKQCHLPMPILLHRGMALLIDKRTQKKMNKWGWDLSDIFLDTHRLINQYVQNQSNKPLSLQKEKEMLEQTYHRIYTLCLSVDKTLGKAVLAEKQKSFNGLSMLEAKLLKAEKRAFETELTQIQSVKNKLFPQGMLQERVESGIPYIAQYYTDFFDKLIDAFDPIKARGISVFSS